MKLLKTTLIGKFSTLDAPLLPILKGNTSIRLTDPATLDLAKGLPQIKQNSPDLVIVDTDLLVEQGLTLSRCLRAKHSPMVIFVASNRTLTMDIFSYNTVDYLVKPREIHVKRALLRAQNHPKSPYFDTSIKKNLATTFDEAKQPKIVVTGKGNKEIVPIHEIDWIDSAGDYICLHSKGKTLLMRSTLKTLMNTLEPLNFMRIHRSTIVNVDKIRKIQHKRKGDYALTLDCGTNLKISRNYNGLVHSLAT